MEKDYFFRNSRQTILLEHMINKCETIEEFEKYCSDDFLNKDTQIGDYLSELLYKYAVRNSFEQKDRPKVKK